MRDISLIVIHHSASPLATTAKQIATWHAARFRLGTGYHRVIESDGSVFDGRKVQWRGAHAKGSNTGSIGICLVGNNTLVDQHWTEAQENALYRLLRYFHQTWPNVKVCGHRDTPGASTLCPGRDIDDMLIGMGMRYLA
jgi:N-acetylmuramoyl-L-alanine amidase